MPITPVETIAVPPDYRPCTKNFKLHYSESQKTLDRHNKINTRNWEIADLLEQCGETQIAEKLIRCHTTMVGNDPNDLRSSYYCQQPLYCGHCASLKAKYQTDQVLEATKLFSQQINCKNLALHKILIKPDTESITDDWQYSLRLAIVILLKFRRRLRRHHECHNSETYLSRRATSAKTPRELKLGVWGPLVNTIHVVPRHADNHVQPYAHMHLTVFTSDQTRVASVLKTVTDLFKYSLCDHDVPVYEYGDFDVQIPKQRSKTKNGAKPESRIFSADGSDENDKPTQNIQYLCRPLKPAWEADAVVEHAKLLSMLKLDHRSLRQFLGKEGTTVQHLPCEFDPERLNPRFMAEWDTDNSWLVRRKVARDSSPAKTST